LGVYRDKKVVGVFVRFRADCLMRIKNWTIQIVMLHICKKLTIKTKQKFLQSKMLSYYFIVLGLGLCLYMYEYTSMMTMFWFCLYNYFGVGLFGFTLRPRQIVKENLKIDNLIDKFRINDQLEIGRSFTVEIFVYISRFF
jgi:hypothetical protein